MIKFLLPIFCFGLALQLCGQPIAPDVNFGIAGKSTVQKYFEARVDHGDILPLPNGKFLSGGYIQLTYPTFCVTRHLSNGTIDSTFDNDGKVYFTNLHFGAKAMALQPDGKILAAGSDSTVNCVRLLASGALDTSFNGSGAFKLPAHDTSYYVQDMVMQRDGKIVITGLMLKGSSNKIFICRLNSNGTLDYTFNGTGKRIISLGTGSDYANAIAVQPDGKILVAGSSENTNTYQGLVVLRLDSTGRPDSTFGTSGYYALTGLFYSAGFDIVVQPDNKILIGGHHNGDQLVLRLNSSGIIDNTFGSGGIYKSTVASGTVYTLLLKDDGSMYCIGDDYTNNQSDYSVLKLTAAGQLDLTFNNSGKKVIPLSDDIDMPSSAAVMSDSSIVIGGNIYGNTLTGLAKVTANGATDSTFGDHGVQVVRIAPSDELNRKILLQPDGKILTLGEYYSYKSINTILRYSANGKLDSTFGSAGAFSFNNTFGANDFTLQPDGKIIIAGTYTDSGVENQSMAVMRITEAGKVDSSFNGTGLLVLPNVVANPQTYNTGVNNLTAVAIQTDGKIIAAGNLLTDATSTNGNICLVRILADGTLDNSYGVNGRIVHSNINTGRDDVRAAQIQPDNKIVLLIGGMAASYQSNITLARFNTIGNLDPSFNGNGYSIFNSAPASDEYVRKMKLQADGKIVVLSSNYSSTYTRHVVARFKSNGVIDSSFNGNGRFFFPDLYYADAMDVDTADNVYLSGKYFNYLYSGSYDTCYIKCIKSNGVEDYTIASPASDAYQYTLSGSQILDMLVRPDGSLLVAGSSGSDYSRDYTLLQFRRGTAFPVNDYRFTANAAGHNINITWRGANESNVLAYVVEVLAPNARSFEAIHSTRAFDNTNSFYRHEMVNVPEGVYLIRIKIVSKDGSYKFTRVERVTIITDAVLSVLPNPVAVNVVIGISGSAKIATIKVEDMQGRIVRIYSNINSNSFTSSFSNLPTGSYVIQVTDTTGKVFKKVVLKN